MLRTLYSLSQLERDVRRAVLERADREQAETACNRQDAIRRACLARGLRWEPLVKTPVLR